MQFSELLLGEHHDPRDDKVWKHHGFLNRQGFWRVIQRWTVVSQVNGSKTPLNLDHLQQVCSRLDPDPRSGECWTLPEFLLRRDSTMSTQLN